MFLQPDFGSSLVTAAHLGQACPGHEGPGIAGRAVGSEDDRDVELISKASFPP